MNPLLIQQVASWSDAQRRPWAYSARRQATPAPLAGVASNDAAVGALVVLRGVRHAALPVAPTARHRSTAAGAPGEAAVCVVDGRSGVCSGTGLVGAHHR